MNIAFLFNSDDPKYNGYYGPPIMKNILGAGVLQNAQRNMRIFVGDILTYGQCQSIEDFRKIYTPYHWDKRKITELENTFNKATVYCWLFQNITEDLGNKLNQVLNSDSAYLGALAINFAYMPHQVFFKNSLIEKYRLHNGVGSIFYSVQDEDPDVVDKEIFENSGFKVVYEDSGARQTIFDNYYDSLDHQKRIQYFEKIYISRLNWTEENVSDLTLNLEELHPYLFNILFAATRALERADVKEELSQAYLSGRRFMEHIADFLYPPSNMPYIGNDQKPRDVKQDDYKNRIAAYIETTLNKFDDLNKNKLTEIGKEMNRLYELFCRGVHKPHSNEKDFQEEYLKCSKAFSDLGLWLSELIAIDAASIRRPYLAYGEEIKDFLKPENQLSMLKSSPDVYIVSDQGIQLIKAGDS